MPRRISVVNLRPVGALKVRKGGLPALFENAGQAFLPDLFHFEEDKRETGEIGISS